MLLPKSSLSVKIKNFLTWVQLDKKIEALPVLKCDIVRTRIGISNHSRVCQIIIQVQVKTKKNNTAKTL